MRQIKSYLNIAFISTYPSRDGGIASFTEDFITTMDYAGTINTHVIVINNSEDCSYDNKVIAQIKKNEKRDYFEIAKRLNTSKIDLLILEHEFDIFGGDQGDYILDLVNNLDIPILTILHTIRSEPSAKQKFIINELGNKSVKIVTMAHNTKEILQTIYHIKEEKIEVINHGVQKKQFLSREILKTKFGYTNRQIISTFGAIGPAKGLEYGIEAIAKVINNNTAINEKTVDYKNILYLILSETNPDQDDESMNYRFKLEELVNKFDLGKNVKFVNKSFTRDEIIHYIQLSDIYMTPYLDKEQAVSGSLAYAVGYGKAIISTPYLYAEEMLSEGNGLLAEFNSPDSLADCIKQILDDPFKKAKMERNTLKIGRTMYWDKIAQQYTNIFLSIINSVSEDNDEKNI